MKDEVTIRQAYQARQEKRDVKMRQLHVAENEANPNPRTIYDLRNELFRLGAQIGMLSWVLDDEMPPVVNASGKLEVS